MANFIFVEKWVRNIDMKSWHMAEESIHQNYLKVGTSCDYDLVNDNDRIC